MIKKHRLINFIICISVSFICLTSKASDDQNYELQRQELLMDMNNVKTISLSGDLDKLERISNEMEKKWSVKDKELYGYMMLQVCGRFTSYNFRDNRQYELARQYAILALEKSNKLQENSKIPIKAELKLVTGYILSLYNFKEESLRENWPSKRSSISKLYFQSWNRMENAIDLSFDPNKPLPPWPKPSKFDGIWIPGMLPESIKDPVVRAEYQEALDKFRDRMEWDSNQRRLRRLEKIFIPKIQGQILQLYSGPVFDSKNLETEALKQDIEKYVKDEKIKFLIETSTTFSDIFLTGWCLCE